MKVKCTLQQNNRFCGIISPMLEKFRRTEQSISSELAPDPVVIDVLRGEISGPIQTISRKPGSEGKLMEVRLARSGPGLFGLDDWQDNKEWSGITNHVLLSARYAVYFAKKSKPAVAKLIAGDRVL